MTPPRTYRLAVFAPHPVQYHVGIYRELAKLPDVDSTVFYEDRIGLEPVYVDEFRTTIQWDIDLLSGYRHAFIRNLSRNPQGGFFARANPAVPHVIRKGNFDAVLLGGYSRLSDCLVFSAARLTGSRLIFRGEATLRPRGARITTRARLKNLFLSRFLKQCNVVLYSCTGNRKYFEHYGVPNEKLRLIPCAVDNDFFQRKRREVADTRDAVREELGFARDDFVVVFAAQMTKRKRPEDLIEAVSRLDRSDVAVLFIGDGPLREELQAAARDRNVKAHFAGFVNQGQISRFYAVGDAFALLSEYDNSPKALNEAMNFAMPVICTTITGTAYDLVVDGENGFHVEAGDVEAITDRLNALVVDRQRAHAMGKRSLQLVSQWSFAADAATIRDAICCDTRLMETLSMPDLVFKTPPNSHHFFGYYDKSPLDADGRRLLAQRATFIERMVEAGDSLELGFFNWCEKGDFIRLAETRAWNWQQGCMLQWLGPDHTDRVVYNDRRDGRFASVIQHVPTGKEEVLPMAVYTVNPSGTHALCIDNERHYWFRPGYNYQGIENSAKRAPLDANDGISLLDLESGATRQIINIMTLIETKHLSTMNSGTHYLEHLMFSPNGKRFCFLHRWKMEDGGIYARFYTANADGSNMRLLADSGRMSHFNWLDDEHLVAYGGIKTKLNQLRRHRNLVRLFIKPLLPLYHMIVPTKSSLRKKITGDGYMILNDTTGDCVRLAPEVLREDGHPTRCPTNPDLLLSDTYEDADHNREVFLLDMKSNQKIWTEKLRSIPELDSTGMRCDLHPKWCLDGTHFAVDTMNDGHRAVYVYAMGE